MTANLKNLPQLLILFSNFMKPNCWLYSRLKYSLRYISFTKWRHICINPTQNYNFHAILVFLRTTPSFDVPSCHLSFVNVKCRYKLLCILDNDDLVDDLIQNYESDDDNDNAISLDKIKNDTLGLTSAQDDSRPVSRQTSHAPSTVPPQGPFQPSATPVHLEHRYLHYAP